MVQAIGKPHTLWCAFAKFYEKHGDVANARIIFDKATEVCMRSETMAMSRECEAGPDFVTAVALALT